MATALYVAGQERNAGMSFLPRPTDMYRNVSEANRRQHVKPNAVTLNVTRRRGAALQAVGAPAVTGQRRVAAFVRGAQRVAGSGCSGYIVQAETVKSKPVGMSQ